MHETYDVIVLGAGMAGLSAAYKLAKGGKSVLVLEKDAVVGGLAKTLTIDGFQFDYCAHRFHTPDPAVLQEMKEMMGDNFVEHKHRCRMHMFGKYLKYPFELQNLLRAMPPLQALRCGMNFLWNMLTRGKRREATNYRDWFVYHFGSELYRVMCEPYTRKIWGMDPALISADWADQRFQGPNVPKLIKKTIKKLLHLDFSSFELEDRELAPDAANFYYPRHGGIQAMPERFRDVIEEHGGTVLTNVRITAIDPHKREVHFTKDDKATTVRASESLITTIPLHVYAGLLQTEVSPEVQAALQGLRYMDIIFVLLFIDKSSISNDKWLYFSQSDIAFNRAVEFKNWSETMAPADKTSLCLDITVTPENAALCQLPPEELIERCKADCERVQLCGKDEVTSGRVFYVPFAYPVYDLEYRAKLQTIIAFIEGSPGVYCIGRTGVFRYQNSDGSIDMGFQLAGRLLDPACRERSLFTYAMKGVSY